MIATTLGDKLNVNLNLLQVFLHVAEHRSFKRAAVVCRRSHSVVSSQIKALEDQLSVRLFNRTTRSVYLTPEGEELVEISRRILEGLKNGLASVQTATRRGDCSASIACSNSIAGLFIPPVIKKFAMRHPEMRVSISEMSLAKMAPRIVDGEFDFGIAARYPCHPALEFEPLVDDALVAIIPKSLPQSRLCVISLEELSDLPLLLTGAESVTQHIFRAAAEAKGLELKNLISGSFQPSLLLPLVSAGLGATVMTLAGSLWAQYSNVTMVPINDPSLTRVISIVTARGRKLPGASRHLSRVLQTEIQHWKKSQHELPHVA